MACVYIIKYHLALKEAGGFLVWDNMAIPKGRQTKWTKPGSEKDGVTLPVESESRSSEDENGQRLLEEWGSGERGQMLSKERQDWSVVTVQCHQCAFLSVSKLLGVNANNSR